MRKLGFLAAAAGLALSGSLAKADFVISSTRTTGPTIGTQTTDIVDFTITNTGTNGTGTTINSIDIALYSPTGMYVGAKSGHPDVFFTAAASANDSWIGDQLGLTPGGTPTLPPLGNGSVTGTAGGSVLALGANPTTTAGTVVASVTSVANQLFQGIAGVIDSTSGADPSPLWFARAVVPTGATVELFNPGGTASAPTGNAGRLFEPNSGVFSPLAGNFAATNNLGTPYTNSVAVPEPTSVALAGIGAAGLLARRRRTA